jgi:hypothetical protein
MRDRITLLAVAVATVAIGTFFLQGWRGALFALLGGITAAGVVIFASRRSTGKQ